MLKRPSCWYHIPVNVFKRKFEKLIIEEIRFLAVAVADVQSQSRCISYLWPIKSVRCKPRSTLSVEQAGKINESDELYWLFELDKAIAFEQNIQIPADYSFTQTLRLTTMDKLNSVNDLSLVSEVYEGVIHR